MPSIIVIRPYTHDFDGPVETGNLSVELYVDQGKCNYCKGDGINGRDTWFILAKSLTGVPSINVIRLYIHGFDGPVETGNLSAELYVDQGKCKYCKAGGIKRSHRGLETSLRYG